MGKLSHIINEYKTDLVRRMEQDEPRSVIRNDIEEIRRKVEGKKGLRMYHLYSLFEPRNSLIKKGH